MLAALATIAWTLLHRERSMRDSPGCVSTFKYIGVGLHNLLLLTHPVNAALTVLDEELSMRSFSVPQTYPDICADTYITYCCSRTPVNAALTVLDEELSMRSFSVPQTYPDICADP